MFKMHLISGITDGWQAVAILKEKKWGATAGPRKK